jgi:hypothetical protein
VNDDNLKIMERARSCDGTSDSHRWVRLLKQPTSITVYRLPFRFPYIYVYMYIHRKRNNIYIL